MRADAYLCLCTEDIRCRGEGRPCRVLQRCRASRSSGSSTTPASLQQSTHNCGRSHGTGRCAAAGWAGLCAAARLAIFEHLCSAQGPSGIEPGCPALLLMPVQGVKAWDVNAITLHLSQHPFGREVDSCSYTIHYWIQAERCLTDVAAWDVTDECVLEGVLRASHRWSRMPIAWTTHWQPIRG